MEEKLIDKSISKLKMKIEALSSHIDNYYKNDCETAICRELAEERDALIIVLSELETYREKIIHLSDEEYRKVIDNAQKDIKSELEKQINNTHILQSQLDVANAEKITYKKITKKLADKLNEAYFEENDFWLFFEKEILKGVQADYGYVGDVIIDWAKREVEKDE